MRALVISGAPGAGKTSLARYLAEDADKGVHLETDRFFDFVPNLIDPSMRPAHEQNTTIVRAYSCAAKEYVSGGFAVFMDGVIGPWMFPVLGPILGDFDYALLSVPHDVSQQRVSERDGKQAKPDVVARMYPQFEQLIETYRKHVIETEGVVLDDVARKVKELREAGALTIHP